MSPVLWAPALQIAAAMMVRGALKKSAVVLIASLLMLGCQSEMTGVPSGGPALIPPFWVPTFEIPSSENPASTTDSSLPYDHLPAIYRDYGPLFATEGEWTRESVIKPWSSWWYPLRDSVLFKSSDGKSSPLEKYDRYRRETRQESSAAAEFESLNLFQPQAQPWEGLCHAWALASLLFSEPTQARTVGGIQFTVSDQKALIIKSFEKFTAHYYGQRSQGGGLDWTNIQPQLFHRFVMAELIERGRPFVMNKVPGMEVWNVPVWKADISVTRDQANPRVFHVQTALVGALVHDQVSDVPGTRPEVNLYYYDLYSTPDEQGREFVIAGKWTGISQDLHPSIRIPFPERDFGHSSRNPELKFDVVGEILSGNPESAEFSYR